MNKEIIYLSGISEQSLVNGPGLRKVYFSQGCSHHCHGCFNPETWEFKKEKKFLISKLINSLIRELNYIDGISFSGGDPFDQCDNFYKFAKKIKAYKLNIWCWTGYTFEQLLELGKKKRGIKKLLELIDVIVDGRFIEKLKSNNCKYRGSTNQRIIDVKKSLQYKKTILFKIN